MEDKTFTLDGEVVTVKTEQLTLIPLSYKMTATHPAGATHESTITLTNKDLTRVPTLQEAQKMLDDARQSLAQKCHFKAKTSGLAVDLR